MKLVTKPHLLKVSVLFYLTLNKGESSNPKEKNLNKIKTQEPCIHKAWTLHAYTISHWPFQNLYRYF